MCAFKRWKKKKIKLHKLRLEKRVVFRIFFFLLFFAALYFLALNKEITSFFCSNPQDWKWEVFYWIAIINLCQNKTVFLIFYLNNISSNKRNWTIVRKQKLKKLESKRAPRIKAWCRNSNGNYLKETSFNSSLVLKWEWKLKTTVKPV